MIGKSNVITGSGSSGPSVEIVTFADGTDEQIMAMLDAHYAGEINISDYWAVGDKRKIHLNAMEATGVSESQHADDYDFVILDFDHDELVTPIGDRTKAALTLQTDRILYKNTTDETYSSSYPAAADEGGYMNSSNTNSGGWKSCARRTWCNNVFFDSLPAWVQNTVKTVGIYTDNTGGGKDTASYVVKTEDKCFLPAEFEIFGTRTYANSAEKNYQSQYEYFKTASNRYKKPGYSTYASAVWWERSVRSSDSSRFCYIGSNGNAVYNLASGTYGIAPCFCL